MSTCWARSLAKGVIDKESGEVLADANTELTDGTAMNNCVTAGVKKFEILYGQ